MGFRKFLIRLNYVHIVPLLWAFIVFPIFLSYVYSKNSLEGVDSVIVFTQMFLPIMGLFWPYIESFETICSMGNELLFMSSRSKMKKYVALLVLYCLILIPGFLVANELFVFNNIWLEYGRTVSITCLMVGLYYAVLFLSGNYMITCIINVIYVFVSMYCNSGLDFLCYISFEKMTLKMFMQCYIVYFVIGLILIGVGYFANKRYRKFN